MASINTHRRLRASCYCAPHTSEKQHVFNCIKDIQYEFAGISVLEFRILTDDPDFLAGWIFIWKLHILVCG